LTEAEPDKPAASPAEAVRKQKLKALLANRAGVARFESTAAGGMLSLT
jgi:hypothetical protein